MEMSTGTSPGIAPFVERCDERRKSIKEVAAAVKQMRDELTGPAASPRDHDDTRDVGEMIANLMLTYRHLEDASMRLGKAIQAHDGGKSVYDPESTVGA